MKLLTLPAKALTLLASFFLLLIVDVEVLQAQNEDRAREIFEEVDRRRNQFRFEESVLEMDIVNPRGQKRSRVLKSWSDTQGDDLKTLIRFESPADVRGTSLLTVREKGAESQRIFLPAVGRIQQITGGQKNDRFMGSDFTYEDLGFQAPDDYTFTLELDSDSLMIVHATKKAEASYRYMAFHIHPQRYVLLEAHYFKTGAEPVKRLLAEDFEEIGKDNWRANKLTMFDLVEKRHTEIRWKERQFPKTIAADVFTERYLRRGVQ